MKAYAPISTHKPRTTSAATVFWAEGLASVASNLLMSGIFFYTAQQFHWGLSRNLMLASGQGLIYVAGALAAGRVSGRWGRRRTLVGLELIMGLVAAIGWCFPRPAVMVTLLLAYSALSAVQWPIMESLAAVGAEGAKLSRRLTQYNITWSAVNALTLAGSGTLIQAWPIGIFAVAAAAQLASGIAIATGRLPSGDADAVHHLPPSPSLLRLRHEALWLSRIALPSSYVVVYSLSAMLPSLRVLRPLPTYWRTLVSSGWYIARCLSFVGLEISAFWQERPRLILLATAAMLLGFLGTVLTPADVLPGLINTPWAANLVIMLGWQIVLGIGMGWVYAASLYFGMALSAGSTEHGGYHEALIGLGATLGPAAAAGAHLFQPAGVTLSAAAVGGIIGVSLIGSAVAARVARQRPASRKGVPLVPSPGNPERVRVRVI